MSADDGRQDRDAKATSGINRREVLLTVGGVLRPRSALARWPGAALSSLSTTSKPSVAA